MMPSVWSEIPDTSTCLALMAKYRMPRHVARHSRTVCAVAMVLTRGLIDQGCLLNVDMVRAGALLHDITKRYSFDNRLDHALTGAKLLKHIGYPQLASVVRQHVRLSVHRQSGVIAEAEVVNYSDKRVVENRITTLAERLSYIRDRYGVTPEALTRIEHYTQVTYRLEEEIFALLPGDPEQLLDVDVEKECPIHV
jgi:uncharacterized protein